MLPKAFLICALFVLCVRGDLFDNPKLWDFDLLSQESRSIPQAAERDVEQVTERDREPLSTDYKDPDQVKESPVLKPKNPSFDPDVLKGGVIDIPAVGSGFADPFNPFGEKPAFPFGGFPTADEFFPEFSNRRPGGFFGSFFSGSEFRPWWKGPNVCIEREESTDDDDQDVETKNNETETEGIPNLFHTSISLSNCQQTYNKYECVTKINNHGVVKTFTVRYKCCYGYERTSGASGCDKQIELKGLIDTLENLGAKEFKNLIESHNLADKFKNENLTVFAPSDQAVNDYSDKMSRMNDVTPNRRRRDLQNAVSMNELILNHITAGFIDPADIVNEEIIYSENDNNSIRFNNYPTQSYDRLTTVNCKRITKANNLASNGIVHLIDGILLPVKDTVQDIIRKHPQLSSFAEALENTDLFKKFKDEGHYTVFAPSNEAFDKLESSVKAKLLKGEACSKAILSHHVTAHTVCSSAIIGNSTTHNVEGAILNMERTNEDQLILENKAKIIEVDIMGTNGVIHLIDDIIIPETALRINEALKKEKLTKFQELIEKAGLKDEIDNMKNITVFAPSNEALNDSNAVKILNEIGDDTEKLKQLILYHTVDGMLQSCDMNNNALVESLNDKNPLRVNLYSTLPIFSNIVNKATVNCARITGFDEKTCGSVIHEVNRVLVPPSKSILEIIKDDPKYSTLLRLIKDTEVEKILSESNQTITLLAPTDETFAAIAAEDMKILEENKEKTNEILKNHILTEILCCAGVGPRTWGFNSVVPTMAHQNHQIGRTGSHQIHIGRAIVTSCDNLATNGVIHSVNKILYPLKPQNTNIGGIFLFDF